SRRTAATLDADRLCRALRPRWRLHRVPVRRSAVAEPLPATAAFLSAAACLSAAARLLSAAGLPARRANAAAVRAPRGPSDAASGRSPLRETGGRISGP